MGDDTWMTVFPDSFEPTLAFPYDSFNVEDLHTVDNGVIAHLFPLLNETQKWDFLIGHFLGVDHVGHRVGPDHPSMVTKLKQMNDVLARVVQGLPDDTLLVVMGDHGMDIKGDHGGDGVLETSAGLWVYSKIPFISSAPTDADYTTYPETTKPYRHIQQIDLVPTLSLLLGLPIPFNNLGAVIPEFFPGDTYKTALDINAAQVRRYLDTYRSSASGGELDTVWDALQAASAQKDTPLTLRTYIRLALESCRSLWAQFDVTLMALGLGLLATSIVSTWSLYGRIGEADDWKTHADEANVGMLRGMAAGSVLGLLAYLVVGDGKLSTFKGMNSLDFIVFAAPLLSSLTNLYPTLPALSLQALPLPLILHALSFLSNSFTFWEDRVVLYLLLTSQIPNVIKGFSAPTSRARRRILGFSALFAVCVRLMGISTVCREEQQPYCHVTFFASSSLPSPPLLVLILVIPLAFAFPYFFQRALSESKSYNGLATLSLPYVLRPTMIIAATVWLLEWAESAELLGADASSLLRSSRSALTWIGVLWTTGGGLTLWWAVPTCLEVNKDGSQVTIFGYANAYGAPYLIFWTAFIGLVALTTQLTGQVTLALAVVAVIAHLEVIDAVRDVKALEVLFASKGVSISSALADQTTLLTPSSITFSSLTPLALLATHAFFATGHQATFPSIQWKSAFLLTAKLTYPFSPALVVVNTFGPLLLLALATPLLALWNTAPRPQPAASHAVRGTTLRACLGLMLYFATLLLGTAVSAAFLRRHLMVWKVFAPRFMAAAAALLTIDVGVLIAAGLGTSRVTATISRVFAQMDK